MTQFKSFFLILIVALSVVACERAEVVVETLSQSEAAEILEAELQDIAGGLTSEIENIAQEIVEAVSSGQYCDTLIQDSLAADHQGQFFESEYSSDYSYYLTCGSFNFPQSASFNTSSIFELSTNTLTSDNTSTFSGDATGVNSGPFQIAIDTVEINGDYDKTGQQEFNRINPRILDSSFSADIIDCKVATSSQQIEAGQVDFVFSGTSANQGSFSYTGSITYQGNKTATITIGGSSYPIDWN